MEILLKKYVQEFFSHFQRLISFQQNSVHSNQIPLGLPFYLSAFFLKTARDFFVILPTESEAQQVAKAISFFLPNDRRLLFLPALEKEFRLSGSSEQARSLERIKVFNQWMKFAGAKIIVASARGSITRLPDLNKRQTLAFQCSPGQTMEPLLLVEKLSQFGYHRSVRAEMIGDICLKGEILDIVSHSFPVRIYFSDDTIESIHQFNIETQRTLKEEISTVNFFPLTEYCLDVHECKRIYLHLQECKKKAQQIESPSWLFEIVQSKKRDDELILLSREKFQEIVPFLENNLTLFDYASEKSLILLLYYQQIQETFNGDRQNHFLPKKVATNQSETVNSNGDYSLEFTKRLVDAKSEIYIFDRYLQNIEKSTAGEKKISYDYQLAGIRENSIDFRKLDHGIHTICDLAKDNKIILISSPTLNGMKGMAQLFAHQPQIPLKIIDKGIPDRLDNGTIYIVKLPLRKGFYIPSIDFYLITDYEILGKRAHLAKGIHTKNVAALQFDQIFDLKEGDYVVHLIHGIGKFEALKKMKTLGTLNDYMVIQYADNARLLVPIDQISMVQKYISSTSSPRLDSLGKASFQKTQKKLQPMIEKFAQRIIELQAYRKKSQGYRFPSDDHFQEDFESTFPYQETEDQLRSIAAVKKDMESGICMDRLICGDVGYGKTEVAMRAAFKSVMNGRQVKMIVPTTILAMQHLRTFRERMANFPIRIACVTRFQKTKEIKKTQEELKNLDLDIVIGTHTMLAEKFITPHLGLLIIDEEQKFGVAQKERIKAMNKNVHVLTMSATPIPRTLHLSLSQIRDISIINTPPIGRKSVKTYLIDDQNEELLRAIAREIERNGQIFFMHNRIASIDSRAEWFMAKIEKKIDYLIIHGRMQQEEIEEKLLRFYEGKASILFSTSIIENGIDIPNVNTLVIDQADQLGLAQLYQLRGRVGRSPVQAYAYLLHAKKEGMNERARSRLLAILDAQTLGSGFKIAMRDLEIRGAGNLLGREQSGTVSALGYELYIKLLNRAISNLQNQQSVKSLNGVGNEREMIPFQHCVIHLLEDAFLAETYIADVFQRMEFYKRFAAVDSYRRLEELVRELQERFGTMPRSAEVFVLQEQIRFLAQSIGFRKISFYKEHNNTKAEMVLGELLIELDHFMSTVHTNSKKMKLRTIEKKGVQIAILFDQQKNGGYYQEALDFLQQLTNYVRSDSVT